MCKIWPYSSPGIPEGLFLREPQVPITTVELRVLLLSKLKLFPTAVVYDVGAGTGSVTVEIALQIPQGLVFGLEYQAVASDLATRNLKKFMVANGKIITGDAVETMPLLPQADRIFIGGSGGRLKEILYLADQKLVSGGILAATSVTLHTAPQVHCFMKEHGYLDIDVLSVHTSRLHQVGKVQLWRANNPVQLISATKP